MAEQKSYKSFAEAGAAMGIEPQEGICKVCKQNPTNTGYDTCRECWQKQRVGTTGSGGGGNAPRQGGGGDYNAPRNEAKLPEDYLVGGYFSDKGYLRDELITTQPFEIAKAFASINLTTGQMRRFYANVRHIAQRLDYGEQFESVRPAILGLSPMGAYTVGKARGNNNKDNFELFRQFLEVNLPLAISSKEAFIKGFVPHFQYVVGYFKYLKPKE